MAGGKPQYEKLDTEDKNLFLASMLDEGTPNVAWIVDEHDDMLQAIWEGRDEIVGPEGEAISPRLHLTLHGLVETQLASEDPPVVREVADKLLRRWDRHDVMHLFCTANVDELFSILNEEEPFDTERFTRRVLKLAAESAERKPISRKLSPRRRNTKRKQPHAD
jgi:hypothetical protein